jgi:AcrR family transcriptional regulator
MIPEDNGPRKPGRPRSAEAERAILDATLQLLIEEGLEGMSIEAVAARAGVGKTTIYRRWPSKEELVIALVRTIHAEAPIPDTGNFRADLHTLLHEAAQTTRGPVLQLFRRAIGELASNPRVYAAFNERLIAPRFRQLHEMAERAIARGELRADLDPEVVVDLVAGPLFYHLLFSPPDTPLPPGLADRLEDAIWRGLGTTADKGTRRLGDKETGRKGDKARGRGRDKTRG